MAARGALRIVGAATVSVLLGAIAVGAATQQPSPQEAAITFTKHVAPILQRSCENCHRADGGKKFR